MCTGCSRVKKFVDVSVSNAVPLGTDTIKVTALCKSRLLSNQLHIPCNWIPQKCGYLVAPV